MSIHTVTRNIFCTKYTDENMKDLEILTRAQSSIFHTQVQG